MTRLQYALCAALVGFAAACHPDAVTNSPVVPKAGIHYVNAVPDTGALDFRPVDIVSNSGLFPAPFRAMNAYYQGIEAGSRDIRVFMDGTDPVVASTLMLEQTFAFAANSDYTFLAYGYARTGQTPAKKVLVTTDVPPAVAAGQVHVRVIQLASTLAPYTTTPLDVWVVARGAGPLSGAPTIANTAFEGVSAYTSLAVGTYRMAFTATGTTAPILFQSNMPIGVAGNDSLNPIGGTSIAQSVITALVMPQSVPGSAAPFSFSAVLAFTSLTTTGTTAVDTIVTAVTPSPHGLATGNSIVVNGTVEAAYRGTKVVTVVDATTFTYRTTGTPTAATATGYPFWYRASSAGAFNGSPISSLTSTGTIATVVAQSSHGLATNDIVTITGANQAEYNGTFAVTVTNATTFTYTTNGTPAASPATGIPIFRAGDVDYTRPNVVFIIDRRPPDTAH